MPFRGNPNQNQPERVYNVGNSPRGSNSNDRFRSFARGAGRMFQGGIKGMYTRPQKKKKSGFSSAHFDKHEYMHLKKAKQIAAKRSGSKDQKILTDLKFEGQIFDPTQKYEPNFSLDKKNKVVAKIRKLYGDRPADKAEVALQSALGSRQAISNRDAQKRLNSIIREENKYRQRGIMQILENTNQKPQFGRGAKYITEEKLEHVIKEIAKSDKYAAHSLNQEFMVTDEKQKPGGNSFYARRNSGLANDVPSTPDTNIAGSKKTTWIGAGVGKQLKGLSGMFKGTKKASSNTSSAPDRQNNSSPSGNTPLSHADLKE